MNPRRWIVVTVVVMMGLAGLLVELRAQSPVDITGYYGEKDGEFFRVAKNGEVYQVLWHQKAGDWLGVAIREGENLAVGWHRSDGANLGVSFYKVVKGDKGPTFAKHRATRQRPHLTLGTRVSTHRRPI